MPRQPEETKRSPGRPRLAKHEAKAKIVPVRFSPEDIAKLSVAAKINGQTVSDWIRSAVREHLRTTLTNENLAKGSDSKASRSIRRALRSAGISGGIKGI
jgi:uncharacterized protein (DUF1778 family)